jgi:hypothetical protein
MTSRTGIEYIDVKNEHWDINHWVRGACLYGVMPANGLTYAPQHPCACFPESKMYGLNALVSSRAGRETIGWNRDNHGLLEKGPAYVNPGNLEKAGYETNGEEWPVYRHDNARSGRSGTSVPADLQMAWKTRIGEKLSPPVIAEGNVYIASVDHHTIYSLDAFSGIKHWGYTAGGRIDSPPAIWRGMVFFGSADGHVYCLRADDGQLIWRFRAAPLNRRMMWFEQLESVWPVHGSVLVREVEKEGGNEPGAVLSFVAGRTMFLDGGMKLYNLDATTGRVLSETVMNEKDPYSEMDIQDYARQLNMPVSLPDILSCDEKNIYMRSQVFTPDGQRLSLEALPYAGDPERYSVPPTQNPEHAHLFSPTGFLDDSWWHRTYWVYGSRFLGGWAGYPQAGRVTPSGRILVFDDENVYGFGRLPQYYRWTTPIEHQLFSAPKHASEKENKSVNTELPDYFQVHHHWTRTIPVMARAMVLANQTLFAAGPPDLIDEEELKENPHSEEAIEKSVEQQKAFAGEKGAVLLGVSAGDGKPLTRLDLDAVPVFDGMAAAYNRLYISSMKGDLICLSGKTE